MEEDIEERKFRTLYSFMQASLSNNFLNKKYDNDFEKTFNHIGEPHYFSSKEHNDIWFYENDNLTETSKVIEVNYHPKHDVDHYLGNIENTENGFGFTCGYVDYKIINFKHVYGKAKNEIKKMVTDFNNENKHFEKVSLHIIVFEFDKAKNKYKILQPRFEKGEWWKGPYQEQVVYASKKQIIDNIHLFVLSDWQLEDTLGNPFGDNPADIQDKISEAIVISADDFVENFKNNWHKYEEENNEN